MADQICPHILLDDGFISTLRALKFTSHFRVSMVFDTRLTADEAEQAAIRGLKDELSSFEIPKQKSGPQLDDELILLRFVRGYNLKVKDAAKAFGEMLEYRKANQIDAAREAMYAAAAEGEELAWPATGMPKFAPL